MNERTFTIGEVHKIATAAAEEALARFAATHPLPTCVTVQDAALMLGVSTRTVARMKLPRNRAGKIPYEALLAARAST